MIFSDGGREQIDERFIAECGGMSQSTAIVYINNLIEREMISVVSVQKKGTTYNHHSLHVKLLQLSAKDI